MNLSKLLFPSSSVWFFFKHKQQERLRGVKRRASWQERLPHKGNQQPVSARSSPEGPRSNLRARGNLGNHRQHLGRPACVLGGNNFVLHRLRHFDVYFMCVHTETSISNIIGGEGRYVEPWSGEERHLLSAHQKKNNILWSLNHWKAFKCKFLDVIFTSCLRWSSTTSQSSFEPFGF